MFKCYFVMFLDLQGSCDQNRKSWGKIPYWKVTSDVCKDELFRPWNPAKIADNFMILVLFYYICLAFSEAPLGPFFKIVRPEF